MGHMVNQTERELAETLFMHFGPAHYGEGYFRVETPETPSLARKYLLASSPGDCVNEVKHEVFDAKKLSMVEWCYGGRSAIFTWYQPEGTEFDPSETLFGGGTGILPENHGIHPAYYQIPQSVVGDPNREHKHWQEGYLRQLEESEERGFNFGSLKKSIRRTRIVPVVTSRLVFCSDAWDYVTATRNIGERLTLRVFVP